jgi:hypothetical protein
MTPQERDLAIRTMVTEAGNQGPAGMLAVANIIENRRRTGRWGQSYADVILAKSQFEPWMAHVRGTANDPRRISESDPRYRQAAELLDGARAGVLPDVTGGMTHFYAPKAQAALGRSAPAWAKGPSKTIGDHVFFAPEGPAPNADPSAWDTVSRSKSPTGLVSPGTTPAAPRQPSTPFMGSGNNMGMSTPAPRPQPSSMGDVFGSWLTDGMSGKRENPLLMRALQYAMQPSPSASPPFGGTAANASGGPGIPPVPAPAAGNNAPMQLPGSQPQQPANPFGAIGDRLSGSPFGMLLSRLAGAI